MTRLAFMVILLCIGNCVVPAQNVPLVDTGVVEVQLSGSATWYMGAESSDGSVTLKASRAGRSRMDLQLGTRHLSEISVNDAREPKTYVSSDSGWKQAAAHNSWVGRKLVLPVLLDCGNWEGTWLRGVWHRRKPSSQPVQYCRAEAGHDTAHSNPQHRRLRSRSRNELASANALGHTSR